MTSATAGRVRLILDLDPRAGAPTGTLTAGSGATSAFTGWVGLTRAIELALAAGSGDAVGDPAAPTKESP